MISIRYAYATGCLILLIIWLLIFVSRKDLRREMLWASILGLPFGFIDFFLVPSYWNPDSLFNLIKRYGVGIESFVFIFLMAGIASVLFQFIARRKPERPMRRGRRHLWLLALIPFAYVTLSILYPVQAVYDLMIVGALGSIATLYFRRDLWKQIVSSGILFSLFYLGVFVAVSYLCKGLVEHFYNLKNTWGILVFGVPLEEICVAFFAGAFWSTIYEFTNDYEG